MSDGGVSGVGRDGERRGRSLPAWTATAILVAALAVGAAIVLRPTAPASPAEQARAIAAELRCPDCAGLSAAESPTRAAAEIRRQVEDLVAAGASADEIKATFVARYGDWILLTPPGLVPWLVPLLITGAGVAILGWWLLGRGKPLAEQAVAVPSTSSPAGVSPATARRAAVGIGVAIVVAVGIGLLLPEPFSLAARTVVNQPLAEAQAAEAERQAEIERLLQALVGDPIDADLLSDLADAYLGGSTGEDLQRAAITLLALIGQDPDKPEPYGRLITAYIRAGAWTDAEAATDALEELTPDSVDIPFFRGLIAWQGSGDAAAAIDAFDDFLAAAPDDPRVPMIRALRAEAEAAD